MPKKTGGKRKKRGKKNTVVQKRPIDYKSNDPKENQQYAVVQTLSGDSRLEVLCEDGTSRICHIRGKFRKRNWVRKGNIVVVAIREYQSNKCDLLHKYNNDEARTLLKNKIIPKSFFADSGENIVNGDKSEDSQDKIIFFVEEQPNRPEMPTDSSESEDAEEDWEKQLDDL